MISIIVCRKPRPLDLMRESLNVGRDGRDRATRGMRQMLFAIPVLSENHIRTYWWCSPDKIGMATMTPDRWTARPSGVSLPKARCACAPDCNAPRKKKEFAASALCRRGRSHPRTLLVLPLRAGELFRRISGYSLIVANLSFPKMLSGWIRARKQNQGIIRRDVCNLPSAWHVCRQPVQVAAPA